MGTGAREGAEEAKAILPEGIVQCQGVGGGPAALGLQRGMKDHQWGGRRKELSPLQGSRSLPEGNSNMAPTVRQFAKMLPRDSSGGDER